MVISIIVPIYKGEKYIPDMVDICKKNADKLEMSVKVELIFVNDYPEQRIDTFVEMQNSRYTGEHFVIKCLNNAKNMGIHASRINGVKACTGEYVLMLDQDDKITEDYLASQLSIIGNADVVVANGVTELPDGNRMLYRYGIMQHTVKNIWFNCVFNCRITSPGQCLIRKSAIPDEWLNNPMKNNGSDDYLLWLMMLSSKVRFAINRKPIYIHCYTGENTSLDIGKMNASVAEVLDIAKRTNSVRARYVNLVYKRLRHESGEKKSLFYSVEEMIRGAGERINRT